VVAGGHFCVQLQNLPFKIAELPITNMSEGTGTAQAAAAAGGTGNLQMQQLQLQQQQLQQQHVQIQTFWGQRLDEINNINPEKVRLTGSEFCWHT
jgi:hypothetical protein